jgi:thioredoxin-dependent peroxiredoxin
MLRLPKAEALLALTLLGLVALSGPWTGTKAGDATMADTELKEGMPAPDFTAPSSEGGTLSLHDLEGKVVVLYFYPKDQTPHCTKEACSFRDSRAELQALGAVIIGVSKDSEESHRKFKEKYSLNFPLLSDPDGAIITAYGAWKKGSIFGKTLLGMDRSTVVIDRAGVVRKIWRGVDVKNHDQEVLAFVKTLAT